MIGALDINFKYIEYYYSDMNTNIQKLLKYPAIIKLFFRYPDRNFTILEMSKETRIPYATAWRYVLKLEQSGVVFIEKIGGYNVCRLNKSSPLVKQMTVFLELELSPHRLAVKEFTREAKKIKDVEKVILFGSVARGDEKLTSDADIALVCKKEKNIENKIVDITALVLKKTRIKIVPILLTRKESKEKVQLTEELEKGEVLYERTERG